MLQVLADHLLEVPVFHNLVVLHLDVDLFFESLKK